jgi:hypothetical protein
MSHLDRCIALIKIYVPLVPTELIFNMDESSLSDWEEQGPERLLVLSDPDDQRFHIPID